MDLFRVANRCPVCAGDAASRYHRVGVGCVTIPGPHVHHRCEDCGFSWGEGPAQELSARLRQDKVVHLVG